MLLITCPGAAPRDETEFHYGGQAARRLPRGPRPRSPTRSGREYLFFRDNPKGPFAERWMPRAGLPPLVQRRARHRHQRGPTRLPDRRTAAGDTMTASRRRAAGGRIDRAAPLRFTLRRP